MFLTDLDSRAAVKGSRDPLGLVPLWSHFGRHVVGNLTTVTGSVRGFTTTLLGYHFARQVQERDGGQAEPTLALFLKFEQLAGYCRWAIARDDDFRGIRYVKRNVAETLTVRISARAEDQILSDQKVYGLWGLFSGAARASGLLRADEYVLTPASQAFVEQHYVGALSRAGFKEGRDITELLRQERPEVQLKGKHERLARAIAALLGPRVTAAERAFYREHLVLGGAGDTTRGLQPQTAELMGKLPMESGFDRRELRDLIKRARARGSGWARVADALQRIDVLESMLVPAEAVFQRLQARHGQTPDQVARDLVKSWGALSSIQVDACRALRSELDAAAFEPGEGERWVTLAAALADGDYGAVLRLLLDQNTALMRSRGGSAPWVRISGGRVDVRFRDELSELPGRHELKDKWANNYFLTPLKEVMRTLAA